jgi:hypothetical protein
VRRLYEPNIFPEIRRELIGNPGCFSEANDMMKLMSGYSTSKKPDYKEVNMELDRIESKRGILLNDMLSQKNC